TASPHGSCRPEYPPSRKSTPSYLGFRGGFKHLLKIVVPLRPNAVRTLDQHVVAVLVDVDFEGVFDGAQEGDGRYVFEAPGVVGSGPAVRVARDVGLGVKVEVGVGVGVGIGLGLGDPFRVVDRGPEVGRVVALGWGVWVGADEVGADVGGEGEG
ncbi:hypothetical protein BS50DRAFT_660103, partial [Corynespora cassiicola Philippines]